MTVLAGARLVGTDQPLMISIDDGLIQSIGPSSARPDDPDQIDAAGLMVAPGLIDLQINGAYGLDFTSDPASIWQVGARLPEQGVSAFVPTIITSPADAIGAAISVLARRPVGYSGAEPLGLHLEGPMISPRRSGVHDPSLMRLPTFDLIKGWSPSRGVVLVTMAPELAGAEPVVRALTEAGVVVSAGHSAASYDEAVAGFQWGIQAVTHLFNAMEPFEHRAPGLIGAAAEHPSVVAGLIVDGIHSHASAVRAAWRWFGPSRLVLVTDAMAAAGLGDGDYRLGSFNVRVEGERALDSNGRLAGSSLTLDQAVRNLRSFTGCTIAEALVAASETPARVLGLSDRGRLTVRGRADLILIDQAMDVVGTVIGGRIAYWRQR